MEEFNIAEFADTLKKIRLLKDMSQNDVAIKADISKLTYMKYENNKMIPSLNNFINICRAFEITITDFFTFTKFGGYYPNENFSLSNKEMYSQSEAVQDLKRKLDRFERQEELYYFFKEMLQYAEDTNRLYKEISKRNIPELVLLKELIDEYKGLDNIRAKRVSNLAFKEEFDQKVNIIFKDHKYNTYYFYLFQDYGDHGIFRFLGEQ
ncbi:helix-turn-helix transcriptional regulator [Saccharicrinis sp. FJH54]|uniref:helix-turn-helix transcriptional regulator n=1 Tax=Saccharicrinis sp. FJH54 TaxID=3344665 RepID=UPI0035D42903